jgi:hypothetical protein
MNKKKGTKDPFQNQQLGNNNGLMPKTLENDHCLAKYFNPLY